LTALTGEYLLHVFNDGCHPAKNRELAVRFGRWLFLQQYSPITRDMYLRSVRDYIRFLRGKGVTKSNHLDVQEFLAQTSSAAESACAARLELASSCSPIALRGHCGDI
jgi:Phage integrase, N-terminal SAM-like domain